MSTKVPHAPIAKPALMQNVFTQAWVDWFNKVFSRIGADQANSNLELQANIDALTTTVNALLKPGMMMPWGGSAAPTGGWLLCDGSAVSRSTYSDLFDEIGTAYGVGNGSTTFNLPPEGAFPVNKEASGTFDTIGKTGGAETDALPNHAHSISITTGGPSATVAVQSGAGTTVATSGHTHSDSTNTGNPTTNPNIDTVPPYVVHNFIIKT